MAEDSARVHADPGWQPDRKITLPCSCVGGCAIVTVCEFTDEPDDPEAYVEFYAHYRLGTLRDRLRAAWSDLRGKGYHHAVVWEPEQREALRAWLNGWQPGSARAAEPTRGEGGES